MTPEKVNHRKIDLHVHINPIGDRLKSSERLISLAVENNVSAMTLLMRSEIPNEMSQIIALGKKNNITIIPGVEYQTGLDGESVGVVCLAFDPESQSVLHFFGQENCRRENSRRASKQKQFLLSRGYDLNNLSESDQSLLHLLLTGSMSEKAINFCEIVARNRCNDGLIQIQKVLYPEVWKYILETYSHMPNFKEDPRKLEGKFLYNIYFDFDKEGYENVLTPVQKIEKAVHEAGGVILYSPEGKFEIQKWEKLQSLGLDGIMAWHGGKLGCDGKSGRVDIPLNVIKNTLRNGLLILGGSDFQDKDWKLGVGNGGLFISPRRYKELTRYLQTKYIKQY